MIMVLKHELILGGNIFLQFYNNRIHATSPRKRSSNTPENTATRIALKALIATPHGIPSKSLISPVRGGNITLAIKKAVNGIIAPKAVFSGCHSQPRASISGMVNPELRPTASVAATMPGAEALSNPAVNTMAEIKLPKHIFNGDDAFMAGEMIKRHMAVPSHIAERA